MVRRNQQPATWQDVRNLRLMLWCANLIGPIFIFTGLHANYRDRPSLQWPTASGTMMESLVWHHQASKSSYYYVSVAYRYDVNDKHHIGHQVALWNPDLHGSHDQAKSFVAAHRTNTPVEVYYDPDQPERAVIIPGADIARSRRSIEAMSDRSVWRGRFKRVPQPSNRRLSKSMAFSISPRPIRYGRSTRGAAEVSGTTTVLRKAITSASAASRCTRTACISVLPMHT